VLRLHAVSRLTSRKEGGGCLPGPCRPPPLTGSPRKDEPARFHSRRNRNADEEGAAPHAPPSRSGSSQPAGPSPACRDYSRSTYPVPAQCRSTPSEKRRGGTLGRVNRPFRLKEGGRRTTAPPTKRSSAPAGSVGTARTTLPAHCAPGSSQVQEEGRHCRPSSTEERGMLRPSVPPGATPSLRSNRSRGLLRVAERASTVTF
jgi:hypothetical protein